MSNFYKRLKHGLKNDLVRDGGYFFLHPAIPIIIQKFTLVNDKCFRYRKKVATY